MTDGSTDPEEIVARAAEGDLASWTSIVAELGPLVRGYLLAVGDPDPDAEAGAVFEELARGIDAFAEDAGNFVVFPFDIAVTRQRQVRRSIVGAPLVTVYSTPGLSLPVDVRDALLLRRIGLLDTAQIAGVLEVSPREVDEMLSQPAARAADEEWGLG